MSYDRLVTLFLEYQNKSYFDKIISEFKRLLWDD